MSDLILAAAHVAGVDRVFQIGGAQAIAAMAYGTETVPHVDKIYGPGNIFVVLAKQKLYGVAAIDALPGPTETLLVADETADPTLAAADLLAQAEHDPMASAILLTDSADLAERVADELGRQLAEPRTSHHRRPIAERQRADRRRARYRDSGRLANAYAPEHLCLLTHSPWDLVPYVKHAGGLFIGEDSPEALGDYTTGPSHVMPTGGSRALLLAGPCQRLREGHQRRGSQRAALKRLGPATVALAGPRD